MPQAVPYLQHISGVGLDSAEHGYPPSLFTEVFKKAGELGLKRMAHAGVLPPAGCGCGCELCCSSAQRASASRGSEVAPLSGARRPVPRSTMLSHAGACLGLLFAACR